MKEQDLLAKVLLKLHSEKEISQFFKEIFSNSEIENLESRIKIASELLKNTNYKDITRITGASSATIAKISNSIRSKDSVLRSVLQKI